MHHAQPSYGAGVPWGVPHGHFPGGDTGLVQLPHHHHHQPSWGAHHIPPPSDRHLPPQFTQPAGPVHGRPQPQLDPVNARLKEEQRRRQQEYSHALAEQVRQREQQKLQERDARRREDAALDGPHHSGPTVAAGGGPDRGLFDGLGQNNPSQRTNFGRGRRDPTQARPAMGIQGPPLAQQAQYHHHAPGNEPQLHQHHVQQQQGGWSGHAEALGLVEPQQHYTDPAHGQHMPPPQETQWHAPPSHQGLPPQLHQQSQQPAPPVAGRRMRTDLHDGGAGGGPGDDHKKQLRLQQQLDMQESLRRQIEDKQRQKAEEKRKRDEEERREMEKFEQERRRQQDELERLKEEKRRKAQAEEDHFRVQQQQLAAASAAAQEQRHHRHRHSPTKDDATLLHHQQSPPRNHQPASHQHHSPPRVPHAPPPVRASPGQNPFTNSRAHLFEDPPSPNPHHQQPPLPRHSIQGERHAAQHFTASNHLEHRTQAVDTQLLMEQYEQVRAELERQRQLVEQLFAQVQHQQQRHHHDEPPRGQLTVSDLERLRQELRDELAQREAHHRHELEALRRHHHQVEEPPHQLPMARRSGPANPSPQEKQLSPKDRPPRHGPGRRHDAYVQDAIQDDDDDDVEETLETTRLEHENRYANQRQSRHRNLNGSLSAASLQCESQLVFFDGRVHKQQNQPHAVSRTNRDVLQDEQAEEEEKEEEEAPHVEVSRATKHPSHRESPEVSIPKRAMQGTDNQLETRQSRKYPHRREKYKEDNDDDDALGFFVRRVEQPELSAPERYCDDGRQSHGHVVSVSTPTAVHKSLKIYDINDNDGDEEDDPAGSLDGDTLEAIFQRNLRRHEILSGFEAQRQRGTPDATHWQELGRRLQSVPKDVDKHAAAARHALANAEPSLAASSRWMPS